MTEFPLPSKDDWRALKARADALPDATRLFAESPTRFLVEVADDDAAAFETLLRRTPRAKIGHVLEEPRFRVRSAGQLVVDRGLAELQARWQTPLAEVTP